MIKLFTTYGLEKQAQDLYSTGEMTVAKMVVGDASGESYEPTASQTSLVNQRAVLDIIEINNPSENVYQFFAKVPSTESYTVREVGLIDDEGGLLWVSQCEMDTVINVDDAVLENIIGVQIEVTQGTTVATVDDNVQMASRDYVLQNFQALSEKGIASGYCPLGNDARVPKEFLPDIYQPFSINSGTVENGENATLSTGVSYKKYNYTKTGTLTENDGVISGFGSGNYGSLPSLNFEQTASNADSWAYQLVFTTGNDVSTEQYVFGNYEHITNPTRWWGQAIRVYAGKIAFYVAYPDLYLNVSATANTTYLVQCGFNSSTGYYFKVSDDMGSTWLTNQTSATTTKMRWESNSYTTGIGINGNSRLASPFGGSIDLNSCYITINNNLWWQGVVEGTSSDYDFTVGGSSEFSCDPCVITTADGRTKEFTVTSNLNVTEIADGNYSILKDFSTGALSLGKVTISTATPTNPSSGDYWLDNSQAPLVLKNYTNSAWVVDNSKVLLGECTIASGIVSTLTNRKFNHGWNIETPHIVETYQNGTSWYRLWSDGWCEQGGIETSLTTGSISTTFLKKFKDSNYTIQITLMSTYTSSVSPVYLGVNSKTPTGFTTSNYSATSNVTSPKNWYACGYIN